MNEKKKVFSYIILTIIISIMFIPEFLNGTLYNTLQTSFKCILFFALYIDICYLIYIFKWKEEGVDFPDAMGNWLSTKIGIFIVQVIVVLGVLSLFDVGSTQLGSFFEKTNHSTHYYVYVKNNDEKLYRTSVGLITKYDVEKYALSHIYIDGKKVDLHEQDSLFSYECQFSLRQIKDMKRNSDPICLSYTDDDGILYNVKLSLEKYDYEKVLVTQSGTKYHQPGCIYIYENSYPIWEHEAIQQGYSPCSRCY